MLEYVLGGVILIVVLLNGLMSHIRSIKMSEQIKAEGDLMKENLNHLAGAIISLSELLDDADQVIENISQVPTVGEIIQQALMGFITQKMAGALPDPLIEPINQVISEKTNGMLHGTQEKSIETEKTD